MALFEGTWEPLTGTGFDGFTYVDFPGVEPVTAQTSLAYCLPTVPSSALNYTLWSRGSSAGWNLALMYSDSASLNIRMGADSVNTAFSATFVGGGPSGWMHVAGTWDGSNNGTGMTAYGGSGGAALQALTPLAHTDGSGGAYADPTRDVIVGSAYAVTDYFVGSIAYIARWRRVLSLTELRRAQTYGPTAVPSGLFFLWANRREYIKGIGGAASGTLASGQAPGSQGLYLPGPAGVISAPVVTSGGGDPAPLPSLGLLLGPSSGTHRFTSDALAYTVALQNTSPRAGHKVSSAAMSYSLTLVDSSPVKATASVNAGGDPAPLPSLGLNLAYSGAKRYVSGPIQYTVAMQNAVLNKGHEFNGLPIGFTVEIAPSQSDYILNLSPLSYSVALKDNNPLVNELSFDSGPLSFTTTMGISAFSTGGTDSVYNSPPLNFTATLGTMTFGPRAYLFDSDPLDFDVQYAVITQVRLQWGEVTQAAGTWTQVTKNTASWS